MAECFTLEDLSHKFVTLTSSLKQKIVLRDGIGDVTCNHLLLAVESGISDLEVQLVLMRSEITARKKALENVEVQKQQVSCLQQRIDHMSDNLPQRLPGTNNIKSQDQIGTSLSAIPVTPTFKKRLASQLTPQSVCSSINSNSPTGAPSVTQIKKKAPTLFVPTLDYVTVQEFDSVPKYMKGRMNYEHVNSAIDEFNKAITAKYSLMATKRNKQNDRIKNAIWDYKQQETKDTKGFYFVVDSDLKKFCSIKQDSAGRAILTILRHCNRMREIRTKGITRYAVVAMP